jgi:pimeloyl-ACP methyl ester carboxylesterase
MAANLPSHDLLHAPGASPEQHLLFLHGILGQGLNWRGFARRFVKEHPRWGAVLVDLRAHGDSLALPPPDDLGSAAADLERLRDHLDLPVRAILGHSFGGKVALASIDRDPREVHTLFSVDSLPGARPSRRGSEGTERVVDMLAALPARLESRDAFVDHVRELGFSEPLALWLAQSLARADDGVRFGLDVERIRALLDDYFAKDLWPVIDPPPPGMTAHLVIAGRSTVYDDDDRAHASELARRHPGRVFAHVLAEADHWVHVDDPEGLHRIVDEALRGEVTE